MQKSETVISELNTKTANVKVVSVLDLQSVIDEYAGEPIPPEALKGAGKYSVVITTNGRNPETSRVAADSESDARSFLSGFACRESMDEQKKAARRAAAAAKKAAAGGNEVDASEAKTKTTKAAPRKSKVKSDK